MAKFCVCKKKLPIKKLEDDKTAVDMRLKKKNFCFSVKTFIRCSLIITHKICLSPKPLINTITEREELGRLKDNKCVEQQRGCKSVLKGSRTETEG